MGATSYSLGQSDNGGQILTAVVQHLFGWSGSIILGAAVTLACLTTSVGLVTACSTFFSAYARGVSYRGMCAILCAFSTAVANVGLTQLIAFSVPVLMAFYPIAIVLMLLTFLHKWFKGYRSVYVASIFLTALISLVDGAAMLGLPVEGITAVYNKLPLYSQGVGWILPALAGAVIGFLWGLIRPAPIRRIG
jgi:LIVCS family branched-chain amino acid:cation transporter